MARRLRRILRACAVPVVAAVVLWTGAVVSYADPTTAPTTIAEAQDQLEKYQQEASDLGQQYDKVQEQLDQAQKDLDQVRADIETQKKRVEDARQKVALIALQQYRDKGSMSTLALLTSDDIDTMIAQLSTVQQVTATTRMYLQSFQTEQARLKDLERTEQAKVRQISDDQAKLADLKAQADAKVKAASDLVDRLTAEEQQRLAAEQRQREIQRQQQIADQEAAAAARTKPPTKTGTGVSPAATQQAAPAAPNGSKAEAVIAYAEAQIGKAYVWGGTGPNGYDCSGLVMMAYASVGISLPRTSQAQYGVGTPVSLSQLQPGDLVFYYSGISHVGLYIGNGKIVHASNPRTGILIASVTTAPFMGGRRIL